MGFHIKEFEASDIENLYELNRIVFQGTHPAKELQDAHYLRNLLQKSLFFGYIAYENSKPVAFTGLKNINHENKSAESCFSMIDPAYRRYSEQFIPYIKKIVEYGKKIGLKTIYQITVANYPSAQVFSKREFNAFSCGYIHSYATGVAISDRLISQNIDFLFLISVLDNSDIQVISCPKFLHGFLKNRTKEMNLQRIFVECQENLPFEREFRYRPGKGRVLDYIETSQPSYQLIRFLEELKKDNVNFVVQTGTNIPHSEQWENLVSFAAYFPHVGSSDQLLWQNKDFTHKPYFKVLSNYRKTLEELKDLHVEVL